MKDRHAVTEQIFCVRLPGKQMPDMSRFTLEGCDIVETVRHQRKIRTGGLAGNHFRLVVRNMSQRDWAEQRLALLAKAGVPNYFGEQRFGRQGHNLELVSQWAEGGIQVRDRVKRSLLLSAARSEIFNQVTSERLQYQANLTTLMSGDCVQLTGRGSWFIAEQPELAEIQRRVDADELRITAPLPGRGEAIVRHQAQTFEQPILGKSALTVQLLQKEKVDATRRAMLVKPVDLQWSWQDDQTLMMNFWLPAGSFATSVIRELILTGDTIEDITE